MAYKVFFSYAGLDASNDPWLKAFYEKLNGEVQTLLHGEVFFDKEGIRPGDEWPGTLVGALQECKALVCLYSQNYFGSENCGKEFEVFRRRIDAYMQTLPAGAQRPRLIIPVLWDNPQRVKESLPPVVHHLQFTHAAFGDAYAREGLKKITHLNMTVEYESFIFALLNHLYQEVNAHDLPPLASPPSYQETQSAFHTPQPPPPPPMAAPLGLPANVPLPDSAGLEATWFVYVTGRASDFQNIRQRLDAYGDNYRDWKPYLPPLETRVSAIATSVASKNNLVQDTLYLSQQFVEHLREAERKNTPVVIIIDPWSIQSASYRTVLSDYDEARLVNCGVIIVWNEQDAETRDRQQQLYQSLEQTLWRSMDVDDTSFLVSVHNEAELRSKVRAAIKQAQERLKKRALRLRPEPPGDASTLPII